MRLTHRFVVFGLACGLWSAAGVAPASAQTSERTLYVSVLDSNGSPVTGLDADEFVVSEDGQTREVLRAAPATDRMDVAVLVDNSAASQPMILDLRRALLPFVKRMAEDGHSVAIIGLADRPTVLADYTTSATALEKGVDRVFAQPGSGTVFQDSIVDVSKGLMKRDAPRRAIVVVTAEQADFSNLSYQPTLDALRESGTALHAIVLTRRDGGAMRNDQARDRSVVIDRGTRESGGRREDVLTSMAFSDALGRLADEIEAQYEVVYARPAALIPPKEVDVRVTRPGLEARATPGREKGAS
jgi:VWFA-related protein